ncbi:hypothetical protein SpiGrapes_2711 [Sphaerochaeta pleomorpha str. Grapes]|uniref:Uncharacterized protein n=1 Tax=Sphaerochaeta pleomorpha (strain ATCC BAA-1885 / DSM 22778 / Grapes) TaxID=158190 RepID=G8QVU5_SPHPG|nr:hypothetical protein [Sphaerochaeta pleomorpha]AEV30469.1 hypothetical protein SpiGrapes_2711 [Sphaerochaeta pleomorpha str. Grapes]
MKKKGLFFTLMVLCVAMIVFSSCELAPRSQMLVISNGSDYAIDAVYIKQYGVGSKTIDYGVNILDDGETIAVGEEKPIYLAPYADSVRLTLSNTNSEVDVITFEYNYIKGFWNQKIKAVFNGTDITVSGSGAAIVNVV